MSELRFIDLFSGIGGFRLGLERANNNRGFLQGQETERISGCISDSEERQNGIKGENIFRCVWSNDINKYANQVYTTKFGEEGHYTGDIRGVDPQDIPDHDLLCGGFPCQSFSVAGRRKGFEDTRGTLFFEICRIIEAKRPKLLLLENVKGLLNHDRGRTFTVILQALDELGYWVEWQVLNSKHYGVPQNRERVFIVGHLRGTGGREIFPITESSELSFKTERVGEGISSCLDANYYRGARKQRQFVMSVLTPDRPEKRQHGRRFKEEGDPMFTLTGQDIHGVITTEIITDKERPKGNFLPRERVLSDEGIGRAVSTNESQMPFINTKTRIRRLTPIECERLQGFPDGWTEGISDTQRYKCLGNAVTVNVIEFLGCKLL